MSYQEVTQCLQIYNNVIGSPIGQHVAKFFSMAPPTSKYSTFFDDLGDALKRGEYKSIQNWMESITISFNDCIRAIGENTEIGLCLATILQLIEDKVQTMRKLSNKLILDTIISTSEKLHELLPLFPDNLEELNKVIADDKAQQIKPKPNIPKIERPVVTQEDLDLLVSRLQSLNSDKMVADIMDILQQYELHICQDQDEKIIVDFDTVDPLTTVKIRNYLDSNI